VQGKNAEDKKRPQVEINQGKVLRKSRLRALKVKEVYEKEGPSVEKSLRNFDAWAPDTQTPSPLRKQTLRESGGTVHRWKK